MIMRLAFRYSFSMHGRHRARSIRLAFTIAVSLAAVIAVVSVMEFLQNGRLERIRDVRSFDTVVDGDFSRELRELYPDYAVFTYGEADALISGHAARIRFIDEDYDGGIIMLSGNSDGLVVSYPVFLSLPEYSAVSLLLLSENGSGRMLPSSSEVAVSGIFTTNAGREFDELYAFMPIDLMPPGTGLKTAVKGQDVSQELIRKGYDAVSWKEAESALYSAFMLEKMMMYMVLFLLFIIIAVSMKQTVRIFYEERKSEIKELLILGMEQWRIRLSFILSFMIILITGIASAILLSALFLPFAERYLNHIFHRGSHLAIPVEGVLFLSVFLVVVTLLFASKAERRTENTPLEEVAGE